MNACFDDLLHRNEITPLSEKEIRCYQAFDSAFSQNPGPVVPRITREHSLSLFAYDSVSDIPDLGPILQELQTHYAALASLCKRPYTHLKTTQEVLAIDKVKKSATRPFRIWLLTRRIGSTKAWRT